MLSLIELYQIFAWTLRYHQLRTYQFLAPPSCPGPMKCTSQSSIATRIPNASPGAWPLGAHNGRLSLIFWGFGNRVSTVCDEVMRLVAVGSHWICYINICYIRFNELNRICS